MTGSIDDRGRSIPPRIGKFLRHEVHADLRRISYQVEMLRRLDPRGTTDEIQKFGLAGLLDTACSPPAGAADRWTAAARSVQQSYGARRSLKLMKRRLRADLCLFVEKAHLIRVLDPAFDREAQEIGLTRFLDSVAAWHQGGDSALAQERDQGRG